MNIVIVVLGYTCQKNISISDTFKIAGQTSRSQGYWMVLAFKRLEFRQSLEYQDKTKTEM